VPGIPFADPQFSPTSTHRPLLLLLPVGPPARLGLFGVLTLGGRSGPLIRILRRRDLEERVKAALGAGSACLLEPGEERIGKSVQSQAFRVRRFESARNQCEPICDK
jgi:hypothetical protein